MARREQRAVLIALCVTQITSHGVLYYAFLVLTPAISADNGWSVPVLNGVFSSALVIQAVASVPIGRLVDRHGPRAVMTCGSLLGVLAMAGAALAPGLGWFLLAWLVAGIAMAALFYQPAFAALARWYEGEARTRALTVLTLSGGLASTVFAPVAAALTDHLSWRGAYLVLAGLLAVVTVPLHARCLRRPWPAVSRTATRPDGNVLTVVRSRPFVLLTLALTLAGFTLYAIAVNLVPLLTERGLSVSLAAWALGISGVGQVLGRICYPPLVHRTDARARTVVILLAGTLSTLLLALVPGPAVLLLAVAALSGCCRGIFVLLQATAVIDRWGIASYATLSAVLCAPVTLATAVAPWVGATLAVPLGGYPTLFLLLVGACGVSTLLALGTGPRTVVAEELPASPLPELERRA